MCHLNSLTLFKLFSWVQSQKLELKGPKRFASKMVFTRGIEFWVFRIFWVLSHLMRSDYKGVGLGFKWTVPRILFWLWIVSFFYAFTLLNGNDYQWVGFLYGVYQIFWLGFASFTRLLKSDYLGVWLCFISIEYFFFKSDILCSQLLLTAHFQLLQFPRYLLKAFSCWTHIK